MKGKKLAFPPQRRLVLDIVRAAKTVPTFPVDKWLDLAALAQARSLAPRRISWTALFLRAWALIGRDEPRLRQAFLSWPWRHLYEHPTTTASVSVHRREPQATADELIFCRMYAPEQMTLVEIQERLEWAQSAPIQEVGRDARLLANTPWPLRQLAWALVMNAWGRKKARKLGTFSISSLAGQGAMNFFHPLIVTTSLSFSPVDAETGQCLVTLLCDHRVLDGFLAAECLQKLERLMNSQLIDELTQSLPASSEAA